MPCGQIPIITPPRDVRPCVNQMQCCSVWQRAAVCWQCVAACCGVLRFVAVCCSVLQCVAVCCSVLQCVAVCCSVCIKRHSTSCRLRKSHAQKGLLLFAPRLMHAPSADAAILLTYQHTATHCNTHSTKNMVQTLIRPPLAAATTLMTYQRAVSDAAASRKQRLTHAGVFLQRTATYCTALQHTATHCHTHRTFKLETHFRNCLQPREMANHLACLKHIDGRDIGCVSVRDYVQLQSSVSVVSDAEDPECKYVE